MSVVEELLDSRAPVTLLTHADAAASEFLGAARAGSTGAPRAAGACPDPARGRTVLGGAGLRSATRGDHGRS
jgi:hypothetical protein